MTKAMDRFLADQGAFSGNGGGAAPGWLKEMRASGLAHFAERGFPTTKQEEWRFTSVQAITDTAFALPKSPRADAPPNKCQPLCF